MADTTFEEAKRCPKCGTPGEARATTRVPNGNTVHHIHCMAQTCPWYGEAPWLVQVDRDGQVYSRGGGQKRFIPASAEVETRIHESLVKQLEIETKPGGEVRNPNA